MDKDQRLRLANEAYSRVYESRRYTLSWRGGGEAQIFSGTAGFTELSTLLGISQNTLNNYFSRYRGTYELTRTNPATNTEDICTITRIDAPAKEKRPRGRPRKVVDWDRMGSAAPGNPNGINIAESAKTVPKTRNRRTDDKA